MCSYDANLIIPMVSAVIQSPGIGVSAANPSSRIWLATQAKRPCARPTAGDSVPRLADVADSTNKSLTNELNRIPLDIDRRQEHGHIE